MSQVPGEGEEKGFVEFRRKVRAAEVLSAAMKKKASASGAGADLSALRGQITHLVARNAVAMVQQAIDAVNEEGQYQAVKYLFEMIGLYPASAEEGFPVEDSLVKTLLHHLGLPEAAGLEPVRRKKEFTASDPIK